MFEALIVKPLFNLLVLIYALIPGHNFGLAIIVFTILVRLLMWPLIKKQLHHAKEMRKLQPELKRIKRETKGNRQQESLMVMELYKERQISPFSSIGIIIVQLIILLGLYQGLQRVISNPQAIIDHAYTWIRDLSWLKALAADIGRFDATLFGVVDLKRSALPAGGGIYWPAMLLVTGSAVSQYFQSMQLMPKDKDARTLRQIMKDASEGKTADSSETNAAVGRSMRYFLPGLIFIFTVGLPSALSLYWLVSGVAGYLQQAKVLKQDEEELEAIADKPDKKQVIEGEIVTKPNPAKKSKAKAKKRRKK